MKKERKVEFLLKSSRVVTLLFGLLPKLRNLLVPLLERKVDSIERPKVTDGRGIRRKVVSQKVTLGVL